MAKFMVTLKTIAEEAGVSITTVSRVLRNRGEISPDTRKKILEIAEKLRYRPNLAAQAIYAGKSRTIGVIMLSASYFDARIAFGVHDVLTRENFTPITLWTSREEGELISNETVLNQIHQLIDRRVDAFIIRPTIDARETYIEEIIERHIPLVTVDRDLLKSHGDFVGTDDTRGAQLAAEHLLKLGHLNIAHIAGPLSASTAKVRRQAFEQSVLKMPGTRCEVIVDETFGRDSECVNKLFELDPIPTAVFAANDSIAANIYKAAQGKNIVIGTDLSVIGYADLEFSALIQPPLTTVRQSPYTIGAQAGYYAIERVLSEENVDECRKTLLEPELIVRESTCKANIS